MDEQTWAYYTMGGTHNLSIDRERACRLLEMVRIKAYPGKSKTDMEIIDACLYHYGGTVTEALIDCLYAKG